MKNEYVLITGASKGIGKLFAEKFASNGYNLILLARSESLLIKEKEILESKYKISVEVYAIDLTKIELLKEVLKDILERDLNVLYVINNAGFGDYGYFYNADSEKSLDMVRLNIEALLFLTRFFLPVLKEKKRGGILNVASTAAFFPGPRSAVYYATKSFVLNFTLALREEMKGTGVNLSVLAPGATETDFFKVSGMEKVKVKRLKVMKPQCVVNIGYDAFMAGKALIIPGFLNKLMVYAAKIFPSKLIMKFVDYAMQE